MLKFEWTKRLPALDHGVSLDYSLEHAESLRTTQSILITLDFNSSEILKKIATGFLQALLAI